MRSPDRTPAILPPATAIASAVLIVGIAYGANALAAGMPPWLIVVTAVLVLSASSELLFVGVLAAGGALAVAVAASLLVTLRTVVHGIAASVFLPAQRGRRLLSAHLINDESVAFALTQPPERRFGAFRTVGLAILIAWPLGAVIGVLLGSFAPEPASLGLDAAFPAAFVAILLGAFSRRTAAPAVAGAVIAVAATPFVAAGLAPVAGLVGLLAIGRRRGSDA